MQDAVVITNLKKTYGDFTLEIPSLTLPGGCILGLIGENGAGKSTTIRLLLDLIRKDEGEIAVLGEKTGTAGFEKIKEDIGVVFDEPGFPPSLNGYEIGKILRHTYRHWDETRYADLTEQFGLPMKKKFSEYSRGMKMKLSIAAALSHDPKLLVLDEATSGLDPVVRDEILDVFLDFTRDEDHSILISSHIVSDLEKVCDYISFLHQGRCMLSEEKDTLREKYGLLRCTAEELSGIDPAAVLGRKDNAYGAEAIVRRDCVPTGLSAGPVSIEELFIFMAKGVR